VCWSKPIGLLLIWLTPWFPLALVGTALTGLGYSLVYPGFGVEALLRALVESRGLAMRLLRASGRKANVADALTLEPIERREVSP